MSVPAEKTTSLASLRNELAPPPIANLPQVKAGFTDLQSFELAGRAATALAASTLVPQQFQNHKANCLIALEMAQRIGASPLMVMQNLYIVHGRPSWSAKFLIATFNQCGRFSAIRFEWQGAKGSKDWGCRAWAIEKATQEKIQGAWITWEMVKAEGWESKTGSKWKTIPEQMFMYRAAAWLVNTHAPELSMGLNTQEELGDVYDAQRGGSGEFAVDLEQMRKLNPEAERVVFDVNAAKALIAASLTMEDVRHSYETISEQCEQAGIAVPLEVEAAFKDREAAIEQKN